MISFVGAGPGAPDLLTLRGAQRLSAADIVVWAASLVPEAVLAHCRPDVVVFDSKTMTFDEVAGVYAANPDASIVRLHSGDPSVYGAIAEQIDWCLTHEFAFEIVPGVTSMAAAAAALGQELTVPGVSQSVVLTRLAARTRSSMSQHEDVSAFAAHGVTMAIFLFGRPPAGAASSAVGRGIALHARDPGDPCLPCLVARREDRSHHGRELGRVARRARRDGHRARPDRTGARSHRRPPAQPCLLPLVRPHLPRGGNRRLTAMTGAHPISVVGLVGESFGPGARAALNAATVVVGSKRQLAVAGGLDRAGTDRAGPEQIELRGPLSSLLATIAGRADAGQRVCVLASGDPGFFGIVGALSEHFGRQRLDVHPAPSSVSLAFARIGLPWDDATVVSAHGRPLPDALERMVGAKVAVLTSPDNPPEAVGAALLEADHVARDVFVLTHLGEAEEVVVRTDVEGLAAGHFDPLSVVVLIGHGHPAHTAPLSWGLPESAFSHRNGMITKAEVRAVVLGKLALPVTGVLWDVGAGSGSIAVECARLRPALRVIAVEQNADDATRITANAQRHGVAVDVVCGTAPLSLADLPQPDRVFVGGGGLDVLDAALTRLRPDGVVVASYALVERAGEAQKRLGNLVQISVARGVPTGHLGTRLAAENPVFVCWGPGSEGGSWSRLTAADPPE